MLKVLFVLVNDNVKSIEINFVVSIFFLFSEDTLSSNDIPHVTTIGFIFSNEQSAISLSNLSTRKLLFDWLLYLSVLHMCTRSKMIKRLYDCKRDVVRCRCTSRWTYNKRYNKHQILIILSDLSIWHVHESVYLYLRCKHLFFLFVTYISIKHITESVM